MDKSVYALISGKLVKHRPRSEPKLHLDQLNMCQSPLGYASCTTETIECLEMYAESGVHNPWISSSPASCSVSRLGKQPIMTEPFHSIPGLLVTDLQLKQTDGCSHPFARA